MANYPSALYTSQIGSAGKSQNVGFNLERDVAGKLRRAIASYTTLGTEATNDTVTLLKLPAGAKVISVHSSIAATASVGTAVTVRVGDQTTANRFAGTIDISAGGFFAFTATLGTETVTPVAVVGATNFGTVAGTDDLVTLTFVGITAITAGKVITAFVEYILP